MQAGNLNRRIVVQAQTTSQDAVGQPLQTWSTVYSCWASVDVQNSQLIYATSEFVSKVTHRITMRWTSSVVIQPNMRILYTEATTGVVHTYEIQALLNTKQANRELVAMAYELNGAE
jgi:SPP1 family predicted phage head-tail adaptor